MPGSSRSLTLALILVPALAWGWGFEGHRRLASQLHEPLPAGSCLRQLIESRQGAGFQDQAADPDRWRLDSHPQYDPNEWHRHYLQIDWVNPIWDYPRDWAEAQAKLKHNAERNGRVPWRVEEYYGKLVDALKEKDEALVMTTLAHLSHYVTDAYSVLHDTRNFDPSGLHERWESDMLEARARLDGVTQASRGYYGTLGKADAKNDIFEAIITGNGLVAELISADQQSKTSSGAPDVQALYERVKDLTARRWGDALTLMASLVATAYVEAGAPRLSGMSSSCSTALPQGKIVFKGYPPVERPAAVDPGPGESPSGEPAGEAPQVSAPEGQRRSEPLGCSALPGSAALFACAAALWGLRRRGR